MAPAESRLPLPNTTANSLEEGIRSLVRSQAQTPAMEPAENIVEPYDDILAAGASTIEEIDQLVRQLQITRDYLQSEGERVRRFTSRYAHLTRTASASVKVISEKIGAWRSAGIGDAGESKAIEHSEARETPAIQHDVTENAATATQ